MNNMKKNQKLQVVSIKKYNKITGVHITTKHTGKMQGMVSISTSCTNNKFCLAYSKNKETVCSHCFSFAMHKRMPNMTQTFENNSIILTTEILEVFPDFSNLLFVRFESFGDLQNWVQAANYILIAKANPTTKFALWTKNPRFIEEAIENGFKVPRNLSIGISSFFLNRVDQRYKKFNFVDFVFTVFDKKTADENPAMINCGARSCLKCNRCYHKRKNVLFVNERLK